MNKSKRNKNIILLLFVLVTIAWGAGFPIVKIALQRGVPQFFMMGARFAIAGICLIIIRGAVKKNLHFKKSEIEKGSFLGILLFVAFALQCFGLEQTSPAKSGILTGCYVIVVPILVILFTKKFALKPLVDGAICLFGMMIFFNVFESFSNIGGGDWLTILGAVIFALHMLFLEKLSKNCYILDLTIFQMIACGILAIIASLIFELDQYAAMDFQFMIISVLFLGIFSTGFAYLIQTLAQKNFSATTVSMVACLEAVFATVFSVAMGMEIVTPSLIIGAIFIIFSILRSVLLPPVFYDKFL
ncbi:MAG: DMT family transporter [Clostridia bacterium]|nr:DMT family transporter [Clostridia bacterium]